MKTKLSVEKYDLVCVMSVLKKTGLIILHIFGVFFSYGCAGAVIYAVYKIDIPSFWLLNTMAYAVGVTIILPVLGIICLIAEKPILNKLPGYLYLLLWLGVIIKIVFFTW
ncbi:hypothetical protein [Pedobacter cryoconitis]|uniref:Uncharacterized protein n=1 Tax=Pedobacter cryoconitis TaxID=188932 RepID=A0A7X0J2L6_9SPHI|nr:hypothetical protein [Pedobacter cryoconitis]MBB6499956.1 hypothetical protein [Pedobacter cryoconitis]